MPGLLDYDYVWLVISRWNTAKTIMGACLDKPETQKCNESGEGNGLRFGVASMQGWRVDMEDAHHALINIDLAHSDWSYFAVFDGHAGRQVSAHCAKNLLESILQTEEFRRDDITSAIHAGFLTLDREMRALPDISSGKDKSGSTAVCTFVSPRSLYIANCGDSRAVLSRGGVPVFATRDHKPELPTEKERIQKAGGSVMIQRVNGSLAVSRALGDYEYKNVENLGPCEQLVSPEPEVFVHERQEDADEFLVLACDGVWDVMTNDDLCAFIHSRLKVTDDLVAIANHVIDTCLYKGSRDNMSVVLVAFPGAPRPSAEAQQAEQKLDEQLRQRLAALVNCCAVDKCGERANVNFIDVLKLLANEDIPGLPPGGGIAAKRPLVEEIFKELCPESADTTIPDDA